MTDKAEEENCNGMDVVKRRVAMAVKHKCMACNQSAAI